MTALRTVLEQGDDGQQAFLRLMKGSGEVLAEVGALRKILGDAQQLASSSRDPDVRKLLLSLGRTVQRLERSNTELRSSLTNSKRFFGNAK